MKATVEATSCSLIPRDAATRAGKVPLHAGLVVPRERARPSQRPQPPHVDDLVVPLLRLRKLVALAAARAAPAGHVQLEVTAPPATPTRPCEMLRGHEVDHLTPCDRLVARARAPPVVTVVGLSEVAEGALVLPLRTGEAEVVAHRRRALAVARRGELGQTERSSPKPRLCNAGVGRLVAQLHGLHRCRHVGNAVANQPGPSALRTRRRGHAARHRRQLSRDHLARVTVRQRTVVGETNVTPVTCRLALKAPVGLEVQIA